MVVKPCFKEETGKLLRDYEKELNAEKSWKQTNKKNLDAQVHLPGGDKDPKIIMCVNPG